MEKEEYCCNTQVSNKSRLIQLLTKCHFSSSSPSLLQQQHRPVSAGSPDRRRSGAWAESRGRSRSPGWLLGPSGSVTASLSASCGSLGPRSHWDLLEMGERFYPDASMVSPFDPSQKVLQWKSVTNVPELTPYWLYCAWPKEKWWSLLVLSVLTLDSGRSEEEGVEPSDITLFWVCSSSSGLMKLSGGWWQKKQCLNIFRTHVLITSSWQHTNWCIVSKRVTLQSMIMNLSSYWDITWLIAALSRAKLT